MGKALALLILAILAHVNALTNKYLYNLESRDLLTKLDPPGIFA